MIRYFIAAGIAGLLSMTSVSFAAAEYVRICDTFGASWYYIPGTETCMNPQTGETRRVTESETETDIEIEYGTTELRDKADDALDGVALSLALPNPTVDPGKTFGAAVGIGTFAGSTAIGVGGAFKAGEGLTVSGAIGASVDGSPVGGRAGVNFSW